MLRASYPSSNLIYHLVNHSVNVNYAISYNFLDHRSYAFLIVKSYCSMHDLWSMHPFLWKVLCYFKNHVIIKLESLTSRDSQCSIANFKLTQRGPVQSVLYRGIIFTSTTIYFLCFQGHGPSASMPIVSWWAAAELCTDTQGTRKLTYWYRLAKCI